MGSPRTTERASRLFLHRRHRGRAPVQGPSVCQCTTHTPWSDETEERRLVEEEGLLTKKTWLRKREDPRERVSSCTGPLSFLLVRLSSVLGSSLTILPWPLPTVLYPWPWDWTATYGPNIINRTEGTNQTIFGLQGGFPPGAPVSTHTQQPLSNISYFNFFLYLNKIFFKTCVYI